MIHLTDKATFLIPKLVGNRLVTKRVAICKPGKPGLTSFSETLALFLIQYLSLRKMKVQDKQNVPSGLPEKTGWLRAW